MGGRKGKKETKPVSLAKKIFVWGGYALVASLLLIVFVTGVGPYDVPPASRALDRVIVESQSYGLPLTQEEVREHVPDDENAALIVVPIAAGLRKDLGSYLGQAMSLHAPLKVTVTGARKIVEAASARLDKIQRALNERPGWFIDKDLEFGFTLTFPEVSNVRDVCDIFRCRAYLRAAVGDVDGALADLNSIRQLAQRQSRQFMLIGLFNATNSELRMLGATVQIADLWQKDGKALKRLDNWLESSYNPFDPRPSIRQEFFNGVSVDRNLRQYGGLRFVFDSVNSVENIPALDPAALKRKGLPSGMWQRAFLTRFAMIYNAGYGPIRNDPHPPFGWAKPFEEKRDSYEQHGGELAPPSLSASYALLVTQGFWQLDVSLARVDAQQRLTEAAISVLQYKLRVGKLPADLEEAGVHLIDPFNGQSLKYKLTSQGFRIWCVGEDLKDDGGVLHSEASTGGWDEVVAFPPTIEDHPIELPNR